MIRIDWNGVLPRPGSRRVNGRCMHRVSYARVNQRMVNENWVANSCGGQVVRITNWPTHPAAVIPFGMQVTTTEAKVSAIQPASGLPLAG